ncbi:hypothetical protein CANCADRAFT_40871, partial [Tortispora caseinolytica NRRL Y-17796]
MVVYLKRKPVLPLPPPENLNDDDEVWIIPETGEYFKSYDDYLQRMDFYTKPQFICGITGHCELTYFDALKSEARQLNELHKYFPEPLKGPLLRRVQWCTTGRITALVDDLYDTFLQDFFPGEIVLMSLESDARVEVIIREKATLNSFTSSNNNTTASSISRYRVEHITVPGKEETAEGSQLHRDSRNYTKSLIRWFIKTATTRAAYSGAPYVVRPEYAEKYNINTEMPERLAREEQEAMKRLRRRNHIPDDDDASGGPKRGRKKTEAKDEIPSGDNEPKTKKARLKGSKITLKGDATPKVNGSAEREHYSKRQLRVLEDLETWPVTAKVVNVRPKPNLDLEISKDLFPRSLEIWDYLNTFRIPLNLSPICYDDFLECLKVSVGPSVCELFDEIFCALLTAMILPNKKDLSVSIPPVNFADVDMDASEQGTADSRYSTPEASSVASDSSATSNGESPTSDYSYTESVTHKGSAMKKYRGGWRSRLLKEQYRGGAWAIIVISIIVEMEHVPEYSEFCEKILPKLAPLSMPETLDTARTTFFGLEWEEKLLILGILVDIVRVSSFTRTYLEYCLEESTKYRKERIESLRVLKPLQDELAALEKEKQSFFPDEEQNNEDNISDGGVKVRLRSHANESPEEALAKSNVEFSNLWGKYKELKDKIDECNQIMESAENRVRCLDAQRSRILGRDRFFNTYWWFEGRGFEPEENSHAEYFMGRLWVQGPSESSAEYLLKNNSGIPVTKRKAIEEDGVSFWTPLEWGYYDKVSQIKELIQWLNPWGKRESKLRRELTNYLPEIEKSILERSIYLDIEMEDEDGDTDEDDVEPATKSEELEMKKEKDEE